MLLECLWVQNKNYCSKQDRKKITANKTGRGGNAAGMFVGSKLQQAGREKNYCE